MKTFETLSAKEARLIFKGDIGQLYEDTRDRHIRPLAHPIKDPIGAVGAPILTVGAVVAKVPNAIAGLFSGEQAAPLPDGGLAYLRRDISSVGRNTVSAIGNLLTLHPIKAAGNVIKGAFDAVDVVTVDPILDVGSGIFGHQRNIRGSVARTLAA